MFDYNTILNAMADLEEDVLMDMLKEDVEAGGQNAQSAVEAMQAGMDVVGKRFEEGEYFVGDLIFAGEVMTGAMNLLKPVLAGDAGAGASLGKVLLCTVKDDLHDIGKNIVKAILEAGGFEVVDLGIDTPAEQIVETAREQNIKIIALSGVLTLALDSMKDTVEKLAAAGMRDQVKVIIGGAPVTEGACKMVGADDWAGSPQKTLSICKEWATA